MKTPENPTPKPRNSFQLLGGLFTAAIGVRGGSRRGQGFADVSTGTIVGAILIFVVLAWLGGYAFIQAIKSAVDVGTR